MPSIWSLETNDADAVALYHGIKDCPIATTPWTLRKTFHPNSSWLWNVHGIKTRLHLLTLFSIMLREKPNKDGRKHPQTDLTVIDKNLTEIVRKHGIEPWFKI